MSMNDTIPEGASRTYRVRVPSGNGGFLDLTNYSFVGYLRTKADTEPVVTMDGALDPNDSTSGLIDLVKSQTEGLGGNDYLLELKAVNGEQAHVVIGSLKVQNR